MIGLKGGQAPRATVVELRVEIKRLEAELWKARHTAELEERKQADPERSLAEALAAHGRTIFGELRRPP